MPGPSGGPDVPRIVLDTDMATDCDDAGALAVLHALARRGEAEIAATVVNNRGRCSVGVVAAINAWYGRSDVPLGAHQGDAVGTDAAPFFVDIARDVDSYGHEVTNRADAPDAVATYRRMLADADDEEIVIASIGHLNNLDALLQSGPDAISAHGGDALVADRVDRLVVMGGEFPAGSEHNFAARGAAAITGRVVRNWPTPILFAGYELGAEILTGPRLAMVDERHPVRRAYAGHPSDPLVNGRASWDQTAVLAAARDPFAYWDRSKPGRVVVAADGSNTWEPDPSGSHRYLVARADLSPHAIAREIEALMTSMPASGGED